MDKSRRMPNAKAARASDFDSNRRPIPPPDNPQPLHADWSIKAEYTKPPAPVKPSDR